MIAELALALLRAAIWDALVGRRIGGRGVLFEQARFVLEAGARES